MTTSPALGGDLGRAWLDVVAVSDVGLLERRLAWSGLTPDDAGVARLLIPAGDRRRLSAIRDWAAAPAPVPADPDPREHIVSFFGVWRQLAARAADRLTSELPPEIARPGPAGDGRVRPAATASLEAALVRDLAQIGEPCLWAHFNRRRTPARIVQAHLRREGGPHVDRAVYQGFVEDLLDTRMAEVFAGCPELSGLLAMVLDQWQRTSRRLLTRVFGDRLELDAAFGIPRDAVLGRIESGLSDPHRGGQSVARLEFTSAELGRGPWRVMYKPKDLRIDQAFQDLLAALPPAGPHDAPLRTTTVLSRTGYGYMQHLEHRPCNDDEELRRFYRNAGRLTALLHLLGGTDCHHENLIADGDQLRLVDAETLLTGSGPPDADDLNLRVAGSVTAIGILPQWYLYGKTRIPRDVSALGVDPPPEPSWPVRGWIDLNTDGMVPGEVRLPARAPTSLPVGVGGRNRLDGFIDDFCGGLGDQLESVARAKAPWLGAGGHLDRFAGCRRRVVLRPTWLYVWLRRRQLEPAALQSPQAQRLVLESLARTYLVVTEKPRNWPLLAAEIRQAERLDVPFFDMPIDATDLTLPDGSVIENFFAVSGLRTARHKIEELDDESIRFQVELAYGANLAKNHLVPRASRSGTEAVVRQGAPARPEPYGDVDPTREAKQIGTQVRQAALRSRTGPTEWLGLDVLDDLEKFRYGPLGPSLYGGRVGVALFLAALSRCSEGQAAAAYAGLALSACTDLTQETLRATAAQRARWWANQPLGLAGSGGIILGLTQLSKLLPELDLGERLGLLVDCCPESVIRADRKLDLVFGVAGLIGPLLAVGSAPARRLAELAGDALLEHQQPGGGWATLGGSSRPLTGFSHGAGGMAAALAVLSASSGQGGYRNGALRAQAYERGAFDPVAGNWPDFRVAESQGARFMLSWCHGAPGIALARMCLESTGVGDAETRSEIVTALGAAARPGPSSSDTLCCGRLGRGAILRLGADHLGDPNWRDAAAALEGAALRAKVGSGAFLATASYGLFTGIAGIGLALLATAAVDQRVSGVLRAVLSGGTYRDDRSSRAVAARGRSARGFDG